MLPSGVFLASICTTENLTTETDLLPPTAANSTTSLSDGSAEVTEPDLSLAQVNDIRRLLVSYSGIFILVTDLHGKSPSFNIV